MQITSQTYQDILASDDYWFERKLVIAGVTYREDVLVEMTTLSEMFQKTPTIGKAVAAEISVKMLAPDADIPTMAELKPYVRAKNATQTSEWLQQGVFYIDTRETVKNERGDDILSLHGFDAMLKAEQLYAGQITGTSTDTQMVAEIARLMGLSVDARTCAIMNKSYSIPFPAGYTLREILGYIASMYVGSFVISDVGELRLVTLLELPPETNYLIDQVGDRITFGGDRILV